MVNEKSLVKTVLSLLEEKRYKELKDIFLLNPVDIATLQDFSEKNILLLFRFYLRAWPQRLC